MNGSVGKERRHAGRGVIEDYEQLQHTSVLESPKPVGGRFAPAGSQTGIAWTNPLGTKYPGVVYPPNITPDEKTGIGLWSDGQSAG